MPAGPIDDRLAVRSPADPRIDVMDRPGFLHVALEAVCERIDPPRSNVEQHEVGLAADPADKGEALAVGRGSRPDCPAGARDIGIDVSGLPIEPLDHIDLA